MRQYVSAPCELLSQYGYSCELKPSVAKAVRPLESTLKLRYLDSYAWPLKRTRWFHIASLPVLGIGNGKAAWAPSMDLPSFSVLALPAFLTVFSVTNFG